MISNAALTALAPLVAFAWTSPAAQDDLPPGVLLLSRVKRHMREGIARLPDYTCLETAFRYHRRPGRPMPSQPDDTVVLEVLFSGDKELYGSPGVRDLWQDSPTAFTGGGLSGNGLFALHLRSLFVNDNAMFTYQGEEKEGDRRIVRYDYRIPLMLSGFTIHKAYAHGSVASRGSFWADAETLDLTRLDIHAEEIPAQLDLLTAYQRIDYARTRIGERDVLLPQSAEMTLVDTDGSEGRNFLEFTHCQAFAAESKLSFDSPSPPAELPGRTPSAAPPPLGEGLTVTLELDRGITDRDTVGSLISARVAADVREKRKVIVAAGAEARGRIRRLERREDGAYAVGLEFTHIETVQGTTRFYANVQDVEKRRDISWTLSKPLPRGTEEVWLPYLPGVAQFFVTGPRLELPKGFRTVWKTKSPR